MLVLINQEEAQRYLNIHLETEGSSISLDSISTGLKGTMEIIRNSIKISSLPKNETLKVVVLSMLSEPETESSIKSYIRGFLKKVNDLQKKGVNIVIFLLSAIDYNDQNYNYSNKPQSFAERCKHLNLAALKISQKTGAYIIDVEQLISEPGGKHFVSGRNLFNTPGKNIIRAAFMNLLKEIQGKNS